MLNCVSTFNKVACATGGFYGALGVGHVTSSAVEAALVLTGASAGVLPTMLLLVGMAAGLYVGAKIGYHGTHVWLNGRGRQVRSGPM